MTVVIAVFTNDAWKVRNARSVLQRQRRDTAFKTKNVKSAGGAKGAPINSDINNKFFVKRGGEQDGQNNKDGEEEIYRSNNTSESNTVGSFTTTTERTGVQNTRTSEKSDVNKENKINTNTQTGQPEFSGLAKTYTDNYPVIFNIMLWFGVVFVFSLLAICIAIADMDPGRDSIIYRMTSNRMKKDN
ncbi:PREDICTED: renin receptor [Wasmannia auropunctata]|uniref:renin receptor n=1 Tax=Wasmannia auropunctata TaxID=64793 RepID=UPI0005ED7024|nr:PREDICTED: renin receptor [Wasmannia auropunctata]